jgi:hypothetical protein
MKDQLLWRLLSEEPLDAQHIQRELAASHTSPANHRAMLWGKISHCLQAEDTDLRKTALRALGGATRRQAIQWMLDGLREDAPDTRDAALQALYQTAIHEPVQWLFPLLHHDPSVRQQALAQLPKTFPLEWLLWWLADPDHHQRVKTILRDWTLPPNYLTVLLSLDRAGIIERNDTFHWLSLLPLKQRMGAYIEALPHQRDNPTDDLSLPQLEAFLTSTTMGPDQLDVLFAMLMEAIEKPTSSNRQQAQDLLSAIWKSVSQGHIPPPLHKRIATSLARVGFHQWFWTPEQLAICARTFPLLLTHRMLPIHTRKLAAQCLTKGQPHSHSPELLGLLLASDLPYTTNGQLDLATIGGLLFFFPERPFLLLNQFIRKEDIHHALLRQPEALPFFLARYPQSKQETAWHHQWLKQCLAADTPPALVAELVSSLSVDRLGFLSQLKHQPVEQTLALLRALQDKLRQEPGAISEKKRGYLAAQLATQLQRDLPAACTQLTQVIPDNAFPENAPDDTPELAFQRWQEASKQATYLHAQSDFKLASDCFTQMARHQKALLETITKLPLQTLTKILWLEQGSPYFPFAVEIAIGEALRKRTEPGILVWLEQLAVPVRPKQLHMGEKRGDSKPLPKSAKEALKRESDEELARHLKVCYTNGVTGLCDALQWRSDQTPSLEICAALLTCQDAPEHVAEWFQVFSADTDEFYHQLDLIMVDRCERLSPLPLFGSAWLHRWDRHHKHFQALVKDHPGGLLSILDWSFSLRSPKLQLELWSSARHTLQKQRVHSPRLLQEQVTDEWLPVLRAGLLAGQLPKEEERAIGFRHNQLAKLQEQAALLFVNLHMVGAIPEAMKTFKRECLTHLPALPTDARAQLNRWLHAYRQGPATVISKPSLKALTAQERRIIRRSIDLDFLEEQCFLPVMDAAEEAASQMLMLGGGPQRLLAMLLKAATHHTSDTSDATPKEEQPPVLSDIAIRSITSTISLWPEEISCDALHALVEQPALPVFFRFSLAMALFEREERPWSDVVALFLREDSEQWMLQDDWQTLILHAPVLQELATSLCLSSQFIAYSQSLNVLLAQEEPLTTAQQHALTLFLEQGTSRAHSYRIEVAELLLSQGCSAGYPLLFFHVFQSSQHATERPSHAECSALLQEANADELLDCLHAAWLAGSTYIDLHRLLSHIVHGSGLSAATKQRVALLSLEHSADEQTQQQALSMLQPTRARQEGVKKLAKAFAWGLQKGRELTGKLFTIEMIGGDNLGYTKLEQPRIFINPLPMLRGEPKGESVVKGLILHEFGHHIYHADKVGLATWEQAVKEQLQPLLNLVSDEQLERSLRAKDEAFGDELKLLAAYAFQHAERDMDAQELLFRLGPSAFGALCGAPIQAGRKRGTFHVHVGRLLFDLERQGMSFARFVRALRMGLGNRHNDPKVGRALRLFRKRFRHSTMPEMLEIARALRSIFGDEVQVLGMLSQDHNCGASDGEVIRIGEGMTQEELQREIERQMRGKKNDPSGPPVRAINVAKGEDFAEINTIQRLTYDRNESRRYAQMTQRWSTKMRGYFRRMGLDMVPQRKRLQGQRLDRTQLKAAVIRRDPRILVARKLTFKTDLFLGIVIDCSGSMAIDDNMEKARLCATMLAEAAAPIKGIDARFFGFTDSVIYDAGTAQRCAAHALQDGGGNNDSAALWHAIKQAKSSPRHAKLIVMISDGSPTECTVESLRALVQRASERMGICCAQIALRSLDEVCFPHYIEILDHNMDTALYRFGSILSSLVAKTLQG